MDHQPPASLLPEDTLVDILSRLAPRGLAVSRAVCRAWHAAVDGRGLLRADLLPLAVAGIFINFWNHPSPEYFFRPSTGPRVSGHQMEYVPSAGKTWMRTCILGQCNGLLLLEVADDGGVHVDVVNPATRAWAPVPPAPPLADEAPAAGIFFYRSYLVFDPTSLSPYYEVISVPHIQWESRPPLPAAVAGAEWPLSRCVLRVFSSRGEPQAPF
nr:unnamed protein product [Digitaria exilis]CAB3498757.1 unnamed protein product [Digitaria exilis]